MCAQCSPNRLTIPSSMVVRPPGEMSPTQVLDALGVAPPQWGGLLGGSAYSTPSIDTANRHSWAGSISSPGEQSPPGLFDWRISEETPTGMEEVRVCSDCYSGSTPGPNDARHISAATASIHRTWNGSSSSATQGRPLASELWSSPGINTPDANGRRRRQSVSCERKAKNSISRTNNVHSYKGADLYPITTIHQSHPSARAMPHTLLRAPLLVQIILTHLQFLLHSPKPNRISIQE